MAKDLSDMEKVAVLTENLKVAEQLLSGYGWFPMGTHSEQAYKVHYFSWGLSDETGMPYYERVYSQYIGLGSDPGLSL